MTLKTTVVVQPSSSRNRTESQSVTLSTEPCYVSSQKAQTYFFLINHSWYIAYVVLFTVETWSLRFRRFIFQLCQSTLAAHSAWKVIYPRIYGLISGSGSLDFRLLPPSIFSLLPVLSPLGLAFAHENWRKLASSETSVQQQIILSSRH